MKKLVALILVLCLTVGVCAFAAAEKYAVILKTTNSDFWRTMYEDRKSVV